MADQLSSAPPLSPSPGTPVAAAGPSFAGLAPPQAAPATPGQSEIASVAMRIGMEVDLALKSLAQSIPTMAPWVEKTALELRDQLGQALQSGAVPTSAAPTGAENFPGGGNNL